MPISRGHRIDLNRLHERITDEEHERLVRLAVRMGSVEQDADEYADLFEEYQHCRQLALDGSATAEAPGH